MKILVLCSLLSAATLVQSQVLPPANPNNSTVAVTQPEAGESNAVEKELPWTPQQATGAPDTPRPGDYSTAWAAGSLDARPEWLMLDYADATTLDSVRIYESYNPGAISKVIAFVEDGREVSLVADRSGHGEWTSEYRPPEGQALRVRRVRIDINEPAIPGYNEIDAVGLKGTDGSLQWAIKATASSYYGQTVITGPGFGSKPGPRSWSTAQVIGEPNTPLAGDFGTAWAPSQPDGGAEWLLVTFASPLRGKAIEIHQSCGPGAIASVDLMNAAGQPFATLQATNGVAEMRPGGIVVLKLPFDSTDAVKQARINLDTKLVPSWNEIDAVAIKDQQDSPHWAVDARASTAFGGDHHDGNATVEALLGHAAESSEKLDSIRGVINERGFSYESTQTSVAPNASRQKGAPWSPEQATAAPDTDAQGDYPTAWAPRTVNAGKEWLRVDFPEPAPIEEVRVHDSNVPGAIVSIAAVLANGTEVPMQLDTPEKAQPGKPQIVIGKCPKGATLNAQTILITLDTTRTPTSWPEIDAVELVGTNGARQWAARAKASSSYAEMLAWTIAREPFQRATTLEEANQRIEQLNERLRALEARIQDLDRGGSAPGRRQ
jgi:hypothetical protein